MALLSFKKPMINAMLNLGGTLKHIWMWSGCKCPSTNSTCFWRHSCFNISPTAWRNLPYNCFFRHLGTITTWYLHSHRTCDKLCQSCLGSSSSSALEDFPGGRTYFISRRNGRTFSGSSTRGGGFSLKLSYLTIGV